MNFSVTYIGGPTAILDVDGLKILTDPTFDPAGSEYRTPVYTLHKTRGPAIEVDAIGPIHVALVSHDHHFDNLDRAGRALLERVPTVITTVDGAMRLGGTAKGLEPWDTIDVAHEKGVLTITATPARHGPAGSHRGPVIGFGLASSDRKRPVVYISGDTVWYEDIAEIGRRLDPDIAILFMGAARVAEVGAQHLTFTAVEGVEAARIAFPSAAIVPLHFEGWAHFSESRDQIEDAFAAAGLSPRLRLPQPAVPMTF